jgi:hypothetical protein
MIFLAPGAGWRANGGRKTVPLPIRPFPAIFQGKPLKPDAASVDAALGAP